MTQALIVAGGPVDLPQLQAELALQPDLTIAADRGGRYFLQLGQKPQVLVGDLDSLTAAEVERLSAAGVILKRYPAAKDQTDLELALDYAWEERAREVRILGALGGRVDHTLAALALLLKAEEQGARALLLDPRQELQLLSPGRELVLERRPGWAVSLLPLLGPATGVTTSGLAFPLRNENLALAGTRGVHNQFSSNRATVSLGAGRLLVISFQEKEESGPNATG